MENGAQDTSIQGYKWLVRNLIKGTRFSVSFILGCLAEGMTYEEIVQDYSEFPRESLPEVLKLAAQVTDDPNMAA